jgi:hypothetical protein
MKYRKGEKVICRNVPGIVVSYDESLDYYKVREIKTGSIMPFVNCHEIKPEPREEIAPPIKVVPEIYTALENIVGVEEASKILMISPGTVKNMCAQGRLECKKIGNTWVIDKTTLSK